MLPSITPEMIQERMTEVWTQANLAWKLGWQQNSLQNWYDICSRKMREYDYLSNWQTFDLELV